MLVRLIPKLDKYAMDSSIINSGIFIFTCDCDGGCEIHS